MAYFPNGSAGEGFDEQCSECPYGEEPCPVFCAQSIFNYDAVNNKVATDILNVLVKDNGTCMMFELIKDKKGNVYRKPANLSIDLTKGV
jgi:hypothetical protein